MPPIMPWLSILSQLQQGSGDSDMDAVVRALRGGNTPVSAANSFVQALQAQMPQPMTAAERMGSQRAVTNADMINLINVLGRHPADQTSSELMFKQAMLPRQIEQQRSEVEQFNIEQKNLLGREQMQQHEENLRKAASLAQQQAQLQQEHSDRMAQIDVLQRNAKTAEDVADATRARDAETARHNKAMEEIGRTKASTSATKPPGEAAVKEATTIASLSDSIDSAEKAYNATIKARPSRAGQLFAGAQSEFLPKLLGQNVGQGLASSTAPEAQFAEGQLNALSAVIDKLRTGNSRFAIQLYNALRPLVPTVGTSPENAVKKFAMIRQNLKAVLSARLKLAPNQAPALQDILDAVQQDLGVNQQMQPSHGGPAARVESEDDKVRRIKERLGMK